MLRISLILLIAVIFFNTGNSQQSIFNKEISIQTNNESAKGILDILTRETKIYFTYDPRILPDEEVFSFNYKDTKLILILNELFKNIDVEYKLLQDHIVICKKGSPTDIFENNEQAEPEYFEIKGKVIDSNNKKSISFVSVGVLNSTVGIIANENGRFQIKIPNTCRDSVLYVAHIGYVNFTIPIKQIEENQLNIELDENVVSIQEVIIRNNDPYLLIRSAIKNRSINYPQETQFVNAFYREAVQKGDKLLSLSEALIKIQKSPYKSTILNDKIKLEKSRKIINADITDTVFLKLQDGMYTSMQLDIVRHFFEFFDEENMQYYKYRTVDIVSYNNKAAHVIVFKPKENTLNTFYKGKIYIETETYAIIGAEFEVDFKRQTSSSAFVVKKSRKFFVKPLSAKYIVSYKENENKYYLNHVRADLVFKVRKKRDVFSSRYSTFFETAVFKIDNDNAESFNRNETLKRNLVFIDNNFSYDASFWEDKNYILPENSIEEALEQIEVKIDLSK